MNTRQNKVREVLKTETSDILRKELKDPRLGFITITDVEISADLRHARIFVSIMGPEEERARNLAVLTKAKRFVRQSLAKRLAMKVLPEIEFKLDTSVDHGIHILELLEQIERDEEERSP